MKTRSLLVVAALVMAGCSGDGDELADPPNTSSTIPPETVGGPSPTDAPDAPAASAPSTPSTPSTPSPSLLPGTTDPGPLPEIGVPGLDSDDVFCAAWSRFGGTWQVLLVGSTFLGDPDRVAEWEIVSADVVRRAYNELVANLPAELAPEADAVADGYFGVLDRRAASASLDLGEAGVDSDAVERLGRAWVDALALRDPQSPDLTFGVPDDLRDAVAAAAAELSAAQPEIHLDPAMTVSVETPLTDDYLANSCPDRGTLSGQEVDPDATSGEATG